MTFFDDWMKIDSQFQETKQNQAKRKVKWLGNTISSEDVRPDKEKVDNLLRMRRPRNVREH